jgi:hypothetical protein
MENPGIIFDKNDKFIAFFCAIVEVRERRTIRGISWIGGMRYKDKANAIRTETTDNCQTHELRECWNGCWSY